MEGDEPDPILVAWRDGAGRTQSLWLSLPEVEEIGAWGCWPPGSRRGGRVEGDEIELTAEGSSGREGRRGHRVVDVRGGGLGVLEGRRPGRTGEGEEPP
jgi:hypothetical protein